MGPGVDGALDYYQILDFDNKNKTAIVFDIEGLFGLNLLLLKHKTEN